MVGTEFSYFGYIPVVVEYKCCWTQCMFR